MLKTTAKLIVQKWRDNLAVRIPAAVARSARLNVGQLVQVSAGDGGVTVRSIGSPRQSVAQMLIRFDPAMHGKEVVSTGRIGVERF